MPSTVAGGRRKRPSRLDRTRARGLGLRDRSEVGRCPRRNQWRWGGRPGTSTPGHPPKRRGTNKRHLVWLARRSRRSPGRAAPLPRTLHRGGQALRRQPERLQTRSCCDGSCGGSGSSGRSPCQQVKRPGSRDQPSRRPRRSSGIEADEPEAAAARTLTGPAGAPDGCCQKRWPHPSPE
jgi:hypothetical protein